jgi:hypothetical protein
MLCVEMFGDPRVFAETWSTGIVLAPAGRVDIVDWARPRATPGAPSEPFNGIELGSQPLARTWYDLAGESLSGDDALANGGTLRSLAVDGRCQIRIGWTADNRLEFRIQGTVGDGDVSACNVSGEVDPSVVTADAEWGDVPGLALTFARRLGPADRALLRFSPDTARLPLRVGRFAIHGAGFGMDNPDATVSMIQGGVIRLPEFMSDGEEQVYVFDRMVGRGHPIHPGDRIRFGELTEGEVLHLEIDGMIHAQIVGKASDPFIATSNIEPRLLQQLNDQNAMLWVFAFGLGALGITATVIEAAR